MTTQARHRAVRPGTAGSAPAREHEQLADARALWQGMKASVVAIDGADVQPAPVPQGEAIEVGAGGRYDVSLGIATGRRQRRGGRSRRRRSCSAQMEPGNRRPSRHVPCSTRPPANQPSPAEVAEFDRTFRLEIGQNPGFLDGKPGRHWSLNGKLYPRTPMFMVSMGDLVRIVLVNHSGGIHPMHLHGHHFLVLTRDGKAVRPWSTDTLNMLPHEEYEVAFRANNPGLWMLHCHNLGH